MTVEVNPINQRKATYDETSSIALFNEDCLTVMDRIQNKSIDMIFCYLPDGMTAQNKKYYAIAKERIHRTKEGLRK